MYLRQQQPGMTLQTSYIDMKYVYVYICIFYLELGFLWR